MKLIISLTFILGGTYCEDCSKQTSAILIGVGSGLAFSSLCSIIFFSIIYFKKYELKENNFSKTKIYFCVKLFLSLLLLIIGYGCTLSDKVECLGVVGASIGMFVGTLISGSTTALLFMKYGI